MCFQIQLDYSSKGRHNSFLLAQSSEHPPAEPSVYAEMTIAALQKTVEAVVFGKAAANAHAPAGQIQ